jgi:chaperonin GroES
MGFRPLHDRVLVRRVEAEEKTAGGIIIPDTAKEKPMEGEVVSAGPGARGDDGKIQPLDVKAGDRVLFGKWSGTEVKLDGEDLIIMKESDIMGIIEASAARKAAEGSRKKWLRRKSGFTATRASGCCAASTLLPMPSR